ncbi:DUF2313 domain-containing protein [Paenibacillus chondroitinus]|uniref:DUF2313 domain-containing protein n=1 Tax=Paenibacillus chondroitinus TaxID=59842 RepID=A0ABU6D673_9BACL|nr:MULTISPECIES: putative phage tail protein [Paenibacillus]MCY9658109.1 YmfQ family protein [Paenibacillus anseongense]MEB4793229.1 DUF2313 domain-containing protein [Paenibacillus chondroitinus]
MSEIQIRSPSGVQMIGVLPEMYASIHEARALMQSEGVEFDVVKDCSIAVFDQAKIDISTWGLSLWEEALGIKTDISKSYSIRRAVIKSKIRGNGTTTMALLQKVVSSYENGVIEVTAQPALYQITISFSGAIGAPPNIADVQSAVEAIIPAHLSVFYKFRYLSITEVEAMTIDEIDTTTLDNFSWG